MPRYFATFPAGAQEIIKAMLEERLKDLRLRALLDGGVDFETAVPYSGLNMFCFQNVFQVLYAGPVSGDDPINNFLQSLASAPVDWEVVKHHPKNVRTFRLVASCQNKLTATDPVPRGALEKRIARISGLRLDKSRPDTEFWALSRSEGTCWFLKRLSRHTSYDKLLEPGELHPELAYIMCWLSRPSHTDVVLDPFCGYGAIPAQRCKRFPFSKVYAFDLDENVLRRAGEKLGDRPGLAIKRQDVLALDRALAPESVDAVITDPPWGIFRDLGTDVTGFYRKALFQIFQVLKPGGRLILLTAKKEEFLALLPEFDGFSLRNTFNILVSGKKAGLFCLEKPVASGKLF